jgi:arylformamidase
MTSGEPHEPAFAQAIDRRLAETELAAREREYSPSSVLASLGTTINAEIDRYYTESAEALTQFDFVEHRYGPLDRNIVRMIEPLPQRTLMLVYVHGGYWQELSVNDSLFGASDANSRDMGFAAIGYTLAPDASVEQIINEVVDALTLLGKLYPATKLVVAGSSAGAHLVAATLQRKPDLMYQAILMSGIYDLRPLIGTYINDALSLTLDEATRLSPRLNGPPECTSSNVMVVVGEHETIAFHEQTLAYAAHVGANVIMVPGRHHFDLPFELGALLDRLPSA